MKRAGLLAAALLVLSAGCGGKTTTGPGGGDNGGTHLLAYASDRGATPGQYDVFLYDLDALGFRLIGRPGVVLLNSPTEADSSPAISGDGFVIAFVSTRPGGPGGSDVLVFDRGTPAFVTPPGLNTAQDESDPAFTYDSRRLALASRTAAGHWRVRLYDALPDSFLHLPLLERAGTRDDRSPSPNSNGSRIAFVRDSLGNADVRVYDVAGDSLLTLPELASAGQDIEPSMSADGHYVAFASDRAGGMGGFDLYLFDLTTRTLVAMPGINSDQDDRHPSLSRTGSIVSFQSKRAGGLGGWDVWNYDRGAAAAVPGQGPGQSSASDEQHPSLRWP